MWHIRVLSLHLMCRDGPLCRMYVFLYVIYAFIYVYTSVIVFTSDGSLLSAFSKCSLFLKDFLIFIFLRAVMTIVTNRVLYECNQILFVNCVLLFLSLLFIIIIIFINIII
jgi:hypothetical protein